MLKKKEQFLETQCEELKVMLKECNLRFFNSISQPDRPNMMVSRICPVSPKRQALTEEQRKTFHNMFLGGGEAEVEINLFSRYLIRVAQDRCSFRLKDAVIKMRFVGETNTYTFFSWDFDHLYACLFIGYALNGEGPPRIFLMDTMSDECVIARELEEFTMVAVSDGYKFKSCQTPEALGENQGLFICCNKTHELLHIDNFKLDFEPVYHDYYNAENEADVDEVSGVAILSAEEMELYRVQTTAAELIHVSMSKADGGIFDDFDDDNGGASNAAEDETTTAKQTKPLTPEEKYAFTEYRQSEMCSYFAEFDEQDISQRPLLNTDHPNLLDCTDLLQPENQTLTQEQMMDACEAINEKIWQDSWFNQDIGFHTDFDFLHFRQRRRGDTFYLSDAVICLKGLSGDETMCSKFSEFNRLNACVSIGNYDGSTRAFLEAAWLDGKLHYAELSEFSILSTFEVDGRDLGIVTIFSKDLGVTHFEVYGGSPRKKHAPRTDIPAGTKAPRHRGDCILTQDEELVTTGNADMADKAD